MAENQQMTAEMTFASNLRQARLAKGLTQAQVATAMARAGFKWHAPTVFKVENGERQIQLGEALALANILEVTLDDMTSPGGRLQLRIEAAEAQRRLRDAAMRLHLDIEDFSQRSDVLEAVMASNPLETGDSLACIDSADLSEINQALRKAKDALDKVWASDPEALRVFTLDPERPLLPRYPAKRSKNEGNDQ